MKVLSARDIRKKLLCSASISVLESAAHTGENGEEENNGSGEGSQLVPTESRSQFKDGKLKLNGRCPALSRLQTPFFFSTLPPLKTQQASKLREVTLKQKRSNRKQASFPVMFKYP
ncbi:hypothetical protein XENOCAPTIV_014627 [Xenoophorus captivus]|uniref:Uncharacterized protein n=1 Tax=Xenoophorus captivus TaxID=1517983 RepID=A0ABV0RCD7_9TELE